MISINCKLTGNDCITKDIFRLVFAWQPMPLNIEEKINFPVPKAGQFYMIKPERSSVFLGRPISLAQWQPETETVAFLIAKRGKGTLELAKMQNGEFAELTGPLGNSWFDFLPSDKDKPIALVGGGIGIAPLNALLLENPGYNFHLYAGFKKSMKKNEEFALLGPAMIGAEKTLVATEDGKEGQKGFITDFLEPEKYAAVCACGPQPMLKAATEKCKAAGVPCYISMERRMACGLGACLGCTVKTANGNRRCCAEGPIFKAEEVIFDE